MSVPTLTRVRLPMAATAALAANPTAKEWREAKVGGGRERRREEKESEAC